MLIIANYNLFLSGGQFSEGSVSGQPGVPQDFKQHKSSKEQTGAPKSVFLPGGVLG